MKLIRMQHLLRRKPAAPQKNSKKSSNTHRKTHRPERKKYITPNEFLFHFNTKNWNAIFDAIDTNKTEMVSSRELGYFFNKMGTPYTQNQLRAEVEQMDSKYLDHRVDKQSFAKRMEKIHQYVMLKDVTDPGWEYEYVKSK